MSKFRILSLFLCSIFLSACSTNEKYTKSEFSKNKKGVAFFNVQYGKPNQGVSIPFKIKKYDENKEFSYQGTRDSVNSILFLDPGLYYVSQIDLPVMYNGGIIITRPPLTSGIEDNMIQYGAFEVKAGEVISLGILYISDKELIQINNYSILKERLQKSYKSELAPILKDGTFYKTGSLLIKDKNQNTKIVPSEVVNIQVRKILKKPR